MLLKTRCQPLSIWVSIVCRTLIIQDRQRQQSKEDGPAICADKQLSEQSGGGIWKRCDSVGKGDIRITVGLHCDGCRMRDSLKTRISGYNHQPERQNTKKHAGVGEDFVNVSLTETRRGDSFDPLGTIPCISPAFRAHTTAPVEYAADHSTAGPRCFRRLAYQPRELWDTLAVAPWSCSHILWPCSAPEGGFSW